MLCTMLYAVTQSTTNDAGDAYSSINGSPMSKHHSSVNKIKHPINANIPDKQNLCQLNIHAKWIEFTLNEPKHMVKKRETEPINRL